jgi:uncharacterized protein YhbP (UPF0306 family)
MHDIGEVAAFLQSQSTMTLATVDEAGAPRATPLFYYTGDDLNLYWVSSPSGAHSQDVLRTSAASAAIYAATEEWKEIRGVQMNGTVHVIGDAKERTRLLKKYSERFLLNAALRLALTTHTLYRISPSWVRFLDNSVHFAYKREMYSE